MSVFIWQEDAFTKINEINRYANLTDDVKEQEEVFQLYYNHWKENGVTEQQFKGLSVEAQEEVKNKFYPPTSRFLLGGWGYYFVMNEAGELFFKYSIHEEPSSEQTDLFYKKNEELGFSER